MRTNCSCLLAFVVLTMLPSVVLAQTPTDAGGIQQEQQRTLEYYQLQKRLQERPPEGDLIEDQTQKPAPKAPETTARVQVNRIVTNPSEILQPAEIEAITSKVTGREVTIQELFDVIAAFNALYKTKGCVTCQAFLPPQKVDAGTVEVRLVEGKLGEVKIEGATYIRDRFFLERISAKPGETLNVQQLEKDLAFINNTNDVKTAASLKPGSTFGTVDAVVRTQEPQRYGVTIFGDNAGRDEIGRNRLGLIFNSRSVFGLSDPLTVTASGADGTKAGSIAYSVPFTRWGTRAGFQYDASAIEIRSGPFEPLDVTGSASNAGFNITQPVIAENQQRVNVFAGYNTKDSITKFSDVPLTRADTRTFTLGFDAQRFTANGFWYTRQFLTRGSSNWGGDLDFIKYNADGLWTNTYCNGLTTIVRGSFQLANEPRLPSFEQFFIGGMATVRGYPEGLLIGARGYFVSGELQMPILSTQLAGAGIPTGDRLRAVLFFDHGGVVPGGVTGQSFDWGDTLTSTGGGILYNFTKYFSGRVMLGLPLAERGPAPRDWVLHVYVQSMVY